jgi:16S rRNA (cytidine1402-2'-O)-methyltransferase
MQQLDIVEIGHAPDAGRIDEWLRPLLQGHDVALVAEAGCPGIADPGATIVARAHELGLQVQPLVGASSILLALMASGLEGQRFRFVGYLPQGQEQCARAIIDLETVSRGGETQIFIETPYRNQRLFENLLRRCSEDTRLTVAVELATPGQFICTRSVAAWRKLEGAQRPSLHNRPAVFLLLAAERRPVRKR